MAEELLDRAQVGAVLEQMGGERVPERVRVDAAPRGVSASSAATGTSGINDKR